MTHLPRGLVVSRGLIAKIDTSTSDRGTIAAGFIDLQVNGGFGHDFTADPSSIWEVGRRLPETGVTSFQPTIVSAPYRVAEEAIAVLASGPPAGYRGAEAVGLHIEGPWLAPDWRGAHNSEHLRLPDPGVARDWAESGVVKMVTIAPELDGAFEVAGLLSAAGVVVSAGHSGADFDTAAEALRGPWTAVTHLFNKMSPFHHRAPGMVGAALLSDRPCGLIADGIHAHPATVRLAWDLLGPSRLIAVTDAMAATGLGPGTHLLGDQEVTVGPDGPRIGIETLAGSTLTMPAAITNLTGWTGAALEEALGAATRVPADLIGAADRGRLEPGMRADLVLLDRRSRVLATWVVGEKVYEAEAP